MKYCVLVSFLVFGAIQMASAEITSAEYVDRTKMDITKDANQEIQGTYKVTGTIEVPTPELPQ